MSEANTKRADIVRQILVVIAGIATIAFNGVSQAIPIGGRTSADISNQYPTYFTPASYAFSIWSLIYLMVFAYTIYQALPAQRENPYARKIGWLFILTCVLNCAWLTFFQYDLILISALVIIAFLLTLIAIYMHLDIGSAKVSGKDRWLLQLPFSLYLGWLSVATIANISLLGVAQNWGEPLGIAAPTWAAIMIGVASVVGLIIATVRFDFAFVLVLVWAIIAIMNKQSGVEVVTTTALICVIVLAIGATISGFLSFRRSQSLATT